MMNREDDKSPQGLVESCLNGFVRRSRKKTIPWLINSETPHSLLVFLPIPDKCLSPKRNQNFRSRNRSSLSYSSVAASLVEIFFRSFPNRSSAFAAMALVEVAKFVD
ncbi:hypothetical protein Leryth_020901, partial [Lithospermum erythrorhizon]